DLLVLVVLVPKSGTQEGIFLLGSRLAQLPRDLVRVLASRNRRRRILGRRRARDRRASALAALDGRAGRAAGLGRRDVAAAVTACGTRRASGIGSARLAEDLVGRRAAAGSGDRLALGLHDLVEIAERALELVFRGPSCPGPALVGPTARAALARARHAALLSGLIAAEPVTLRFRPVSASGPGRAAVAALLVTRDAAETALLGAFATGPGTRGAPVAPLLGTLETAQTALLGAFASGLGAGGASVALRTVLAALGAGLAALATLGSRRLRPRLRAAAALSRRRQGRPGRRRRRSRRRGRQTAGRRGHAGRGRRHAAARRWHASARRGHAR